MAQYHFHASILKRSEGHSVVASAAYRAGERLYDSRIGYAFDYRRRHGILHTEIMAPDNTPDWMLDRFQLWNGVEKAEERKDSQLARSIDISLMCELTFDQNLDLLRYFVKQTWIDQGMLADIAIHAPGHDSDERNVHAHILLTMRVITADGLGNKQREWNDRKDFKQWRKAWADFANAALERGGFAERIDHRSLVEQGLDREPTIHVGPSGKQIEHRGKNSDRAQKNRDIEAANDNMDALKKELADSEKRLAELKRQLAAERMEQIQKTVRAADAVWEQAEQRQAPVPPLQLQDAPSYPGNSAPPVSAGGKAASMPDDLSEQQKLAAELEATSQKQVHTDEQDGQQHAATDQERTIEAAKQQEAQHQAEAKQQEENRLQQIRDAEKKHAEDLARQNADWQAAQAENKRVEDIARQNAERLAAQSEDMRQAQERLDAQKAEQARLDAAYRAEVEKIAREDRRKQESERQAQLAEKAKEGPINDAGARYGQALGQHYDMRDHYASLAKTAMAEYAAFRRDREALDQQIAKTADPHERQALDLRKRIEGAEYLALTSDRIAQQSWVITGRQSSPEAVQHRLRATDYRIQSQDLRQQLRELREARAPEKDREHERSEPGPEPATMRRPGTPPPNKYDKLDELIGQQDEIAKAKEEREKAKGPELQKQQDRDRERERKPDRDPDRDR